VPEVRSPTVRRRELGALLRKLRTEKGLTVEQAAERLLFSMSKLSRMETGHGIATPRDIRDLCDLYGVADEAERERLTHLAREGKQTGWWQGYDLEYFATYVGLEAAAVRIKYYQSSIVPGLLQTPAYVRAMNEAAIPSLTSERIEELLEVKRTRQQLLAQDPPLQVLSVVDEAVLHRVVGSPAVMAEQMVSIIELTTLRNVTIQVIPYAVGAHPAMDSTFNILDFHHPAPSVVYVEGLVGCIYLERPQEITRYEQVFERLRTVALSPQESIELVAKVGAKYRNAIAAH
jgi:transcriptional regulator with XRE-family HTH domain